jgi:Flp pilus assembly protein TadD
MGQHKRAIQVFQHALDRKIETDRIYSRLGIDYLHLGQTEKAIEAMGQAIRINPTDLNNLQNLGMAYLQVGRVNEADRTFRAITALNDRHGPAHDGLGLVAIQRGDAVAARLEFERAVELDPEDLKALLDLGILYQNTGNKEQALHYLQMFLSKARPGQLPEQVAAVRGAVQELKAEKR